MHKKLLHCGNCTINVIGLCTMSYLHISITRNKHFKENMEQAPFFYFSLLKKYVMIIIQNVR